eukprot:gnl/MRDRNA2_/MRDRNA2_31177_c0_seq1.p1 gnl/MRDRNA2_/MRDRNA2_31177_c0~~gnl/MRDRNA2_/MRDRNA2_31177_c0_seq1.p1  ORF type:complete len:687 (-),score=138.24 gnl/MRDRNA2_/MRDRNA2_31177_c0_seq1:19-2079(-)
MSKIITEPMSPKTMPASKIRVPVSPTMMRSRRNTDMLVESALQDLTNPASSDFPPVMKTYTAAQRGRGSSHETSRYRSNSWSGDTRFEKVMFRHIKDHLQYNAAQGAFVLSKGIRDVYNDAFDLNEADTQKIRRNGIAPLTDLNKEIELGTLRQDVSEARQTLDHIESHYNMAQAELQKRNRNIQAVEAQNQALKQKHKNILHDINLALGLGNKDKDASLHMIFLAFMNLVARMIKSHPLWMIFAALLGGFSLLIFNDGAMVMRVVTAQNGSPQMNPVMCEHHSASGEVIPFGIDFPPGVKFRYLAPEELAFSQPPERACSPRIPLVLDFKNGVSMDGLHDWLKNNQTAARQFKALAKHEGALLLRNLDRATDHIFEELMADLDIQPAEYTGSIGRRDKVSEQGNRRAVTKYPAPLVLMPHIEFGNQLTRPEFITFYAAGLPEGAGETPLIDFAAVWEHMSPELKLKFARGISFKTRLYPNAFQWIWGEYSSTWRQAFSTDDPNEAIKTCRGLPGVKSCTWGWDGALEYVVNFPALHFHQQHEVLSTTFGFWNSELPLLALARYGSRISFLDRLWAYFSIRFKFLSTYTDPTPTRATFIDGAPLTPEDSMELSNLIWEHSVIYSPQVGDTCLVNNEYIGHGRMNVIGPMSKRKIIAFIGGRYSLEEAVNFGITFSRPSKKFLAARP